MISKIVNIQASRPFAQLFKTQIILEFALKMQYHTSPHNIQQAADKISQTSFSSSKPPPPSKSEVSEKPRTKDLALRSSGPTFQLRPIIHMIAYGSRELELYCQSVTSELPGQSIVVLF